MIGTFLRVSGDDVRLTVHIDKYGRGVKITIQIEKEFPGFLGKCITTFEGDIL